MAEATASDSSQVQVITGQEPKETLVLKLHKPKTEKQVQWQEGVVDNEFLGKKSSKCCCIYAKPHKFGESDTESDDDDDDCCHEHRVARRKGPHKNMGDQSQDS